MASIPDRAQTLALLTSRRTVHEFLPERVPHDIVAAALDAARWAPNHHRTEPWRFHLLGERSRAEVIALNEELVRAAQGDKAAEIKTRRWRAVPGWLLLTCVRSEDPLREREDYAACCCAAQNFMLALWGSGVGAKWTTGGVTRDPRLFARLGLDPAREFVVGLFWYGRPAVLGEQQRRALAEVVSERD